MLEPEPPSRFAYILATVLALALVGVWFLLHRESPDESRAPANATAPPAPPPLNAVASVEDAAKYFATWGGYAVWENDTAEFALWSPATRDYTQYFEARRANGQFTFRRINELTRPLNEHGEIVQSPMAFTETYAMRTAFYRRNPNFKPTKNASATGAKTPPSLPPKPPERFGGGGAPRAPAPSADPVEAGLAATIARGDTALLRLEQALIHRRQPPLPAAVASDLRALFQIHPIMAVGDHASAAEIDQAVAQRKSADESILTMARALLTPAQIETLRVELAHDLEALEARRARAR